MFVAIFLINFYVIEVRDVDSSLPGYCAVMNGK
jgi:hypothetical protein